MPEVNGKAAELRLIGKAVTALEELGLFGVAEFVSLSQIENACFPRAKRASTIAALPVRSSPWDWCSPPRDPRLCTVSPRTRPLASPREPSSEASPSGLTDVFATDGCN